MYGKKVNEWVGGQMDGLAGASVGENRRIVGGCEGGGSPTETGRALRPSSDAAEVWGFVSAGTGWLVSAGKYKAVKGTCDKHRVFEY